MAGPRCLELADLSRAYALSVAPNVRIVRRRRTGEIIEVNIAEVGDDSHLKSTSGSSIWLVHKHESETNPPNVWTHKRVPPVEKTSRETLAGTVQNGSSPPSQAAQPGRAVPRLASGKQSTSPICAD